MNREFRGLCLALDEDIESGKIELLFPDSWYWLHYSFFNCRDSICSETSSVVRTHLYNLAAYLYRSFEPLVAEKRYSEQLLLETIEELCQIAEASRNFPLSLWIYGDETSKTFLQEWLAPLPSKEQIEHLFTLPHHRRTEREARLPYRFDEEKPALKRYGNELAAYNKREKLAMRTKQREGAKAEPTAPPNAGSADAPPSSVSRDVRRAADKINRPPDKSYD